MDRNSKILEVNFSADVEHSIIQQSIVDITHYIKNNYFEQYANQIHTETRIQCDVMCFKTWADALISFS